MLHNLRNFLVYMQPKILNCDLPLYWYPCSHASRSLWSPTIASPVVYSASPPKWIFPRYLKHKVLSWTHSSHLQPASPLFSLAWFMRSPSSYLPRLDLAQTTLASSSSLYSPLCLTASPSLSPWSYASERTPKSLFIAILIRFPWSRISLTLPWIIQHLLVSYSSSPYLLQIHYFPCLKIFSE